LGTSDLLLHPVRMRIIQALLGDRELTTADLRQEIPDVPAATLYRQVATLLDGGAIEVVEERKVRGTFERTYRVKKENLHLGADEAATMTTEEINQAFVAFMTGRLSDFERYLAAGDPDLSRDRVGFRFNAMYLSDEETDEFLARFTELVKPLTENEPTPDRKRRIFTTILMPADETRDETRHETRDPA
jgi:hypothetical protein